MVDELIEGAFRCYDRDRIAAARQGRLDRRMRPVFAGEIVSIDGKLAPEDGIFVALSEIKARSSSNASTANSANGIQADPPLELDQGDGQAQGRAMNPDQRYLGYLARGGVPDRAPHSLAHHPHRAVFRLLGSCRIGWRDDRRPQTRRHGPHR
jgi:hypothetical protein